VTIGRDLREIVIRELAGKLRELGYLVVAVSVNGRHLHALVELPNDMGQIRQIVGKCKQRASHAVRDVMPGSIWAAGGRVQAH